jgi:hypothetical protein
MLGSAVSCHAAQNNAPVVSAVPRSSRDFSRFSYAGRWEFVHHPRDGRTMNRSARSYHAGDTLTLLYDGEGFRLYGISGPNGGVGTVVLPGQPPAQISFYAPGRHAHVLMYASPPLKPGVHSAAIVVTRPRLKRRGYVNIDEVQVYGHASLLGFSRDQGE